MKRILCGLLVLAAAVCLLSGPPALAYDEDEIIGEVETLIRGNTEPGSSVFETDLGDVTADALRAYSGADVAIVNGGELRANLQAGQRTWAEIQAVFAENKPLAVADITAAQLWQLLEYGVSHVVLAEDKTTDAEASAFDGFPQVSGIVMKYDLSAPVGERLMYVELSDGRALEREDEDTHITLCATEYMLSGGYGYESVDYERLDAGLAEALASYVASGPVGQPDASRMRTIGSTDNPIISRVSVLVIALACCIFAFCYNKIKEKTKPKDEL